MHTKHLKDKWALITGSSRGIGQQIAITLAKLGCNIVVHGRDKMNNQKTLGAIKPFAVRTISVGAELSAPDQIKIMADQVLQQTGGIDILYNNAGVMSQWYSINATPAEELQRVFQINFFSVVQLCSIFAPVMKEKGFGRIINLTTGMQNLPSLFVYSTSKAALDKYSKELAFEYKDANVLVNILDPGWLKTDLGGQNADHEVETVIPGAIVPALLEDNGPTGQFFRAQDYKYLNL